MHKFGLDHFLAWSPERIWSKFSPQAFIDSIRLSLFTLMTKLASSRNCLAQFAYSKIETSSISSSNHLLSKLQKYVLWTFSVSRQIAEKFLFWYQLIFKEMYVFGGFWKFLVLFGSLVFSRSKTVKFVCLLKSQIWKMFIFKNWQTYE